MRLSEDRISNISHKIHDRLYLDEYVDYTDEDESLKMIKKVMTDFLKLDEAIEELVRHKISTLKKGVREGTPEWDVLFRKYSEEELNKHKM